MKILYLLDENLDPDLISAVASRDERIDILRVGDEGAPPLGTRDPQILRYLMISQRLLVTGNRRSMPHHLHDHFVEGGEHWGVFWIRRGSSIGHIAEELHLRWEASEAEEWHNVTDWIP